MTEIFLDAELVGRLHGYVQWGVEIHWNKQEQHAHKDEVMTALKEKQVAGFDVNKQLLRELKQVIERKQHPLHEQKTHVYHDLKATIQELKSHFRNMHAELFVEDVSFAIERLHENVLALTDTIRRQARLVAALNAQTYDELIPQIFYLYEKEKNIEKTMREYADEMHKKSRHVLKHCNINYFKRLKQLAGDKQYHADHHDLFVAAYLLDVGSRAAAHVHGIDTTEAKNNEEHFLSNIAPF